jgi:outer membrane protein assembly factor BamA
VYTAPRHRRWSLAASSALMLSLAAASNTQAFIELTKNATLVPVPEVTTDPNEGVTVGVLPVVLISNDQQQLRSIVAPDVRYNDITGVYPSLRFFDYPTPKQKLLLQGGKATKIGEYFEAMYSGEDLLDGWLDARVQALHENDPFERFFGFGNETTQSAETNYTSDTGGLSGSIGLNLPYHLQATTRTRWRVVRLRKGGIDSITQLVGDPQYAQTPGIDGATVVGQRFGLRYDTRDFSDIPTEGIMTDGGIEVIDKALGSSASYVKYGLEGRSFLPLKRDKQFVLATQAVLDYIQGGDRAPFYDRSALGGMRSFRGAGSNRYIDNNRCFLRSELRSNVWQPAFLLERFKVHGHIELAPFFELGRVFNSSRTFPLQDPHVAGGLGFRAVIAPQVVAYVDFASTGGGPSVFTGVDYPF